MLKMYLVTLKPQLMDAHGNVVCEICDTYKAVIAEHAEQASKDAVAWFSDNDEIYHVDQCHNQQPVEFEMSCGHAVYLKRHQLRYVSTKAVLTSIAELEAYFSLTSGLMNKHIIDRN